MRIGTPKEVGERLRDAIAIRQITQEQLGKLTGFSRVYINKIVNGNRTPFKSEGGLTVIANALNISPEWLIRGAGQMFTDRLAYDGKGEVFILNTSVPVHIFEASQSQDPNGAPILTRTDDVIFIPQNKIKYKAKSASLKAFTVVGSNMAPTLLDGDLAVVDCSRRNYIEGRIYAFFFVDHVRFRRVRIDPSERLTLLSDSDPASIPPERLSRTVQESLHVIGEVIARLGGL